MGFPVIKPRAKDEEERPKKKRKRAREEEVIEAVIVEEEEEEDEEDLPVFSPPKKKVARLPIIQALSDEEITDDEVVENIEIAINTASSFGRSVPAIRRHLAGRDYGSAAITAKGALLATLVELVPLAESAVRENRAQKGIYQFNSLVSQMREVLIDLEGDKDLDGLVLNIFNEGIDPKLRLLGQMLIQWNTGVKLNLRSLVPPDVYKECASMVDDQTQQLAMYVSQMATSIKQDVETKISRLE